MNIAYVSNFMNHHQLPLSMALLNMPNINYKFISWEPIPEERINMGYEDMNHKYPFVICAYDSKKEMKNAIRLIDEADITIYGSCPDSLIIRRATKGRICIKFSERYFKKGIGLFQMPHNIASAWRHLRPFEKLPVYFCCSSAYTSADINRYTRLKNRAFKWGYFPEVKQYDIDKLMKNKMSVGTSEQRTPVVSILWTGRFIEWKHPESAIFVAEELKQKGYSFELSIIGNGPLENKLQTMIEKKHLSKCVKVLGAMSPEHVRRHMEQADIFLFTSDYNEGWGAVLNEAMNSGCSVVASHAIGSVPYLIKDGYNGRVYENRNQKQLNDLVIDLIEDRKYREMLGRNAYATLIKTWNAEEAAMRFVKLAENLLCGNEGIFNLYENGPCSPAQILKNGWFHYEKNKG